MKKVVIGILGFIILSLVVVAAAGMYKFDYLEDDLYIETNSGEVLKYNDIINVSASIVPVASITNYIGGDFVKVTNIIPAGVSPHNFDLKTNDLVAIKNSDLLIEIGLNDVDGFLDKASGINDRLTLSDGIELLESQGHHDHGDEKISAENSCKSEGFSWVEGFSECELGSSTGSLNEFCSDFGGEFSECESACRNSDKDGFCIDVCVPVCKFNESDSHMGEHSEEEYNHSEDKEHDDHHQDEHHEPDDKHEDGEHNYEEEHGDFEHLDDHEDHGDENFDNHIWIGINNSILLADRIKDKLIKLSPNNREYFESNYQLFLKEIVDIVKEFTEFKSGKNTSNFIVFHDAYNYLLKDTGIDNYKKHVFRSNVLSNPDSKKMKELLDEIKEENIKTIFVEPQFNSDNLEDFISDNDLNKFILDPIGNDSSSKGYINNLKQNLNSLKNIYVE